MHPDQERTTQKSAGSSSFMDDRTKTGDGMPLLASGSGPTQVIVGRYEVEAVLGEGGMGVVYRVFDRELKRIAALKMIHEEKRDARRETRFLNEARAMAKLAHPSCVQIYDIGVSEGGPYMVMELVTGQSLSGLIERREVTPHRVAMLLHQVAGALHCAHENGIVHRDVKPDNILVGPGGAKLADFGIAKDEDGSSITARGALIGTLAYMPPEQTGATGEPVDPRSDVYALGATLYEALVGSPPFSGGRAELLNGVLNEKPVEPRRKADVPLDLNAICMKCLAKAKADRYQSAKELQEELGRFVAGEPVSARQPSRSERLARALKRHRRVFAATLVLVICGALGAASLKLYKRTVAAARLAEGNARLLTRDLTQAEDAFREAIRLEPSLEGQIQPRIRELGDWKWLMNARQHVAELKTVRERVRAIRERIRDLSQDPSTEPFEASPRKQELSAAKRAFADLRLAVERERELAVSALRAMSETASAELVHERGSCFLDVLNTLDPAEAPRQIEAHRTWLLASEVPSSTLLIDSSPKGATVRLYRYVHDPKRGVERPHPVTDAGRDFGGLEPTNADYYPLSNDVSSGLTPTKSLSLPFGDYLVLLELEGYLPARYPVAIRWGQSEHVRVTMVPDRLLGEGTSRFVHVPSGTCRYGRELDLTENLDDFLIMRDEVSYAEWERFWIALERSNDLLPGPPDVALDRFKNRPNAPVTTVSRQKIRRYLAWFASQLPPLRGKWGVDLPSLLEFQRAVRGPFSRSFPWGEDCDESFVGYPEDGLIRGPSPQDSSVFAVRGLAGSVREHITGVLLPNANLVAICGGASGIDGGAQVRDLITGEMLPIPSDVGWNHVGFRVVVRKRK